MLHICSIMLLYHLTNNDFTLLATKQEYAQVCFAETSLLYPHRQRTPCAECSCIG